MDKLYYSIFFVLILFFSACSSGKKAFQQGDYYQAVLKSVNRLRQNPTHKKSRETLKQSYPLAVETLERSAINAISSDSPFKFKESLRAYEQVNSMYEEIRRSPGALRVVPNPKDFYTKVAELKEKAADESYEAGLNALQRDTQEDAKRAYYLFSDVKRFVPGYKDVNNKLDEAKFRATLKVVIEQIPVPTRYDLSARFFQDKIEEYLHTQFRGSQFVRFYTPEEAERDQLPYVDHFLRLQFDDFVVGKTSLERNTESVSKDSVKVGKVTLEDGTKIDAYSTVYAKVTINKKEVKSNGLFSMQVFDGNTNAVLTHRKFNGEYVWTSRWGSFKGDERALSDDQLKACKREEATPPPPQDLFIEFTRPIYNQLTGAINRFYSRY